MIAEITTMIFFSFAAIGAVMAIKWKKKNFTPRLTDEETKRLRE